MDCNVDKNCLVKQFCVSNVMRDLLEHNSEFKTRFFASSIDESEMSYPAYLKILVLYNHLKRSPPRPHAKSNTLIGRFWKQCVVYCINLTLTKLLNFLKGNSN